MSKLPQDLAAEQALVVGMMQGKAMPPLSPDLFLDSRLREAWRSGMQVVADGKDPAIPMICKYANNKILTASDLVNFDEQWNIDIQDMRVYAKSLIGCAAQREALKIIDAAVKMIEKEPGEYAKPLELMVKRSKRALAMLDIQGMPSNRSSILKWISEQEGVFDQKAMYHDMDLKTPQQKSVARKNLARMVDEGLLERVKKKGSGWYRKRDTSEERIDFKNVVDEVIDLKLPFGLNDMFKARPKNIIVIVGDPDTGKTALSFLIAKLNMDGPLPITYFSSEMADVEFRSRLDQWETLNGDDYMAVDHWDMEAIERSDDFHDVIRPNGLNIIDYLEVHEDFWQVGGLIKKIFDKLDKGVCILCIQKTNKDGDTGLGGGRTLEKPRLYLSLKADRDNDWHTMKIVKCKAPRDPEDLNPTGLELDYKLIRGCKFIPVNPSSNGRFWHRPGMKREKERKDDNCFRSRA